MQAHPEVRQAISSDIPKLIEMDHGVNTDHVWQLVLNQGEGEVGAVFREVRLPRPMRVNYPREPRDLADVWTDHAALLLAEAGETPLGYLALIDGPAFRCGWVTDLVVDLRFRRRGVATLLLNSARSWCLERGRERIFVEMQSKNYPAIRLMKKSGFSYVGYSDHYYPDQDIVLFFARELT
ncbi:MAG: GNAT family N-acetyltransferase [Anaerolineales bacterium]|jgi:GNAT superfamily N-acetyltransferase